jgi:dienelactone hydrolase
MVLPGLFTSDRRTAMLRRVLNKAGYQAHGWGLGHNMPIKPDILDRVGRQVASIQQDAHGQPVTMIGWSMGGLLAREAAKRMPHAVAEVITLGSPFSAGPRANRAWPLYELVADHKVDALPIAVDVAAKPPVKTTAIWSARDGIVSVASARGEAHERDHEVEINCGHFAMSCAPDALEAVLRVLKAAS